MISYVKVCDAYGAGFFFIPGSDTCIKIGGRVRADYAFSGSSDVHTSIDVNGVGNSKTLSSSQNTWGWEARGRIDVDARTASAYGTVQAVTSLRISRTSGMLETASADASASSSPTLEAAYVRFAGFTFGAARDNFSFMPSSFYGTGHWASFGNGAKQLAYTAVLGGGFSATVALQDYSDTAKVTDGASGDVFYAYRSAPQVNARLDYGQSWGSLSVMGAMADVKAASTNTTSYSESTQVWAIGAGAKINLPMIGAGDALWLNAAYADGMTEYTVGWASFKSSDVKRNVGGYAFNPAGVIAYDSGLERTKSWNLAAVFHHFLTPQHRLGFLGSYGGIEAPTTAKSGSWDGKKYFGDATVWNLGGQYTWLPVKDFEIGVDALYARVKQDVAYSKDVVFDRSSGNWTGRLRVERNF